MSVQVLDIKQAATYMSQFSDTKPSVTVNFQEIFGTIGCLLNCKNDQKLEENLHSEKAQYAKIRHKRKDVSRNRKVQINKFRESRQTWFSARIFTDSAEQGCRSCATLLFIFLKCFFPDAKHLPEEYEYSISQGFELSYRLPPQETSIATAQLFQPPELNIKFERFRPSQFLLGREKSIHRLRKWMDDCLSTHTSCSQQNAALGGDSNCPARLLDLNPLEHQSRTAIRLVETQSGHSYQYACLSHRWDSLVIQHRTTADNISQNMTFLCTDELPKNFRDAISIARSLGIGYLWIDSLCIIQSRHEGDNSDDLLKELAKMGSIYQHAILTIGAVSSPTSSGGCFFGENWPDICMLLSTDAKQNYLIGARILDGTGPCISKEDINRQYPLLTRGWVLQERLLSTRFLQCNYGELAFECLESSSCECGSRIAPHPGRQSANAIRNINFTTQRQLLGQQRGEKRGHALKYWKTVVQNYMELDLTFPSDVLPAIGGCAQIFAASLDLTYTAGLWEEFLATDLLWHVRQGRSVRLPRPKGSTSPSWSWASVAMRQSITHIETDGSKWDTSDILLQNKIEEVYCRPQTETNPFGQLKPAYLKLNTVLYPWYIRRICSTAKFERPGGQRFSTRDLHVKRHKNKLHCTTNIDELTVSDATVEVMFDVHLGSEGLVEDKFNYCVNPKPPFCTLAKVYLLPVMHSENNTRALDVLLILRSISPESGKPNCYKRIGLIKVMNEQADVRTWDSMILERTSPLKEEFWFF